LICCKNVGIAEDYLNQGKREELLDVDEQNALYKEAIEALQPAIIRLARAYEADDEKRRDLLQEIYLEIWRSLRNFDRRCSLRTWTYRVAHNVGASHIAKSRRASSRLVDLEALEAIQARRSWQAEANRHLAAASLFNLIYRLQPVDRQVILLYLEGEAAAHIADATGLTATNVATKIHRIKRLLDHQYMRGDANAAK